jgi:hypothetical protein
MKKITSANQTIAPARAVSFAAMAFKALRKAGIARNDGFWTIQGDSANFTIEFEHSLVAGVEIFASAASKCEFRTWLVSDLSDETNESKVIFDHPRMMDSLVIELRTVRENTGEVCLRDYAVLGPINEPLSEIPKESTLSQSDLPEESVESLSNSSTESASDSLEDSVESLSKGSPENASDSPEVTADSPPVPDL